MKHVAFHGAPVYKNEVVRAIRDFDQMYEDANDYENWLTNHIYKWALIYEDRQYPPKYVLSLATGLPTSSFTSREARDALTQLGFELRQKRGR
jgi:hypothetical protein